MLIHMMMGYGDGEVDDMYGVMGHDFIDGHNESIIDCKDDTSNN